MAFHTNLSMQKNKDSEGDRSHLQKRAEFVNTSHSNPIIFLELALNVGKIHVSFRVKSLI